MDKIVKLEIFDVMLFEGDAVNWLKKCKDEKREWILTHTSQKDKNQITEFINNPNISKECKCLDCGKNKKDVTNGIQQEITAIIKPLDSSKPSRSNSFKGQAKPKGRKN